MKKNYLQKIVLTGILVALNVILERFLAYSVWNMTISFGFITVAFAAAMLGIPYAIAVGGLGDLIGSLLFPFGAYFPGFTLTNILVAACLAIFIYKRATLFNIILATVINKISCTVILNSIWISILYKGGISAFWIVAVPRISQAVILGIVEIIVITLVFSEKSQIRKQLNKLI
ncbi:MAG: folate family ECF transporter S component [Clostridia bacterium]|nr:folate family ECF transporter S component [Clostridia bacterium]